MASFQSRADLPAFALARRRVRRSLGGGGEVRLYILLVALTAMSIACGRTEDTEPPVATPTVTLNRPDAAVGSPIDMSYRFAVANNAPAFNEDYWVFVHFVDVDGELMWTDDHRPPTPTRQWKPGQTIDYTRTMFVPKFPYTGDTRVEVGLFSPANGTRLPLAGQNQGMRSYRVAAFDLRGQSDNVFVVFNNGWHETEVPTEAAGVEWQWSKREGTLAFRNPKRDATVFLQLDQPVKAFSEPQQVEVRLGSTVVDRFPLPPGDRELRRIPVTADQLGSAETVEMVVAVDKTFVPASTPELRSSDARELGVRVFRVFVQPR
jgi:hypothetical protein